MKSFTIKTKSKDNMSSTNQPTNQSTKVKKTKKLSKLVEFEIDEAAIKDANTIIDASAIKAAFSEASIVKDATIKETFNLSEDKYIEAPWTIIGSYFQDQHLDRLVRHQLESYNNFVGLQLPQTIDMFNPVSIASEQDYDPINKKHSLEIFVTFENFAFQRNGKFPNLKISF